MSLKVVGLAADTIGMDDLRKQLSEILGPDADPESLAKLMAMTLELQGNIGAINAIRKAKGQLSLQEEIEREMYDLRQMVAEGILPPEEIEGLFDEDGKLL